MTFSPPPVRIAMWSGPRNISTTMMRAFENRPDCQVTDEPFYAAYLQDTGYDHPMRAEVLASQPQQWERVAAAMTGPVPDGAPLWYQKHMTHHMRPGFGLGWLGEVSNAFLIRAPEAVLASYINKRDSVSLDEIGLPMQVELFDRVADRMGAAPPVLDARDVLMDPRGMLGQLCARCGVPFLDAMLSWPAGPRPTDGVWAPAWYDKVAQSTGFGPARPAVGFDDLADRLKPIAEAARPLYARLAAHRMRPSSAPET